MERTSTPPALGWEVEGDRRYRNAAAFSGGRPETLPVISPFLLRWFTSYSRRFIRRHFHSLRLSKAGTPDLPADQPLVIFSNHASWWDPIVCLVLKDALFPNRNAYAPIDATMLRRYPLFAKLGFFPVEQRSGRGGAQFVRMSRRILRCPGAILAVTPQSRFADVRERPVRFAAGLGHFALRTDAVFVPLAGEYVFWEERCPEILVRFGEPIRVCADGQRRTAEQWTELFEDSLAAVQDALAIQAQQRRAGDFVPLLSGAAGTSVIYDSWRRLKAMLRGETFRREHGVR